MLKITAGLISSALTLCLPLTVSADPKPAPPPPRILVTYQVLEVPGNTPISVSNAQPVSEVYKTLLQTPGAEATEISVVTPADFPGSAQYSRVLTFTAQDHGKPSRLISAPTTLEATPHINPDGTITVQLKTEVTRVAPAIDNSVPPTNSESWQSKQTFKNGETRMFGTLFEFTSMKLLVGNNPEILAENKELIASQNRESVQFVTVTILPSAR